MSNLAVGGWQHQRMPGLGCRGPVSFVLSGGAPDFTEKEHDAFVFPSFLSLCARSGKRVAGRRASSSDAREPSFDGRSLPSPRRCGRRRGLVAPPSSSLPSGPSRLSSPGAARPPSPSRLRSDFKNERQPVARCAGAASAPPPPSFMVLSPREETKSSPARYHLGFLCRLSGLPRAHEAAVPHRLGPSCDSPTLGRARRGPWTVWGERRSALPGNRRTWISCGARRAVDGG